MFDCGIKACDLVDEIISEADVWPDIPKERYYEWIDEAEQLLYSEIIKELAVTDFKASVLSGGTLDFSQITTEKREKDTDQPRYSDIHAVYADETQLIRSELNDANIFPDCYTVRNGKLFCNTEKNPDSYYFYYYLRPSLKRDKPETTIKLPPEWVCIIRSKLRGEAYKLMNEDVTAAKWINDYNVLVEQFKVYMAARRAEIGSNNVVISD